MRACVSICVVREGGKIKEKLRGVGVGEQKGVYFVGLELRSIKGYLDFA